MFFSLVNLRRCLLGLSPGGGGRVGGDPLLGDTLGVALGNCTLKCGSRRPPPQGPAPPVPSVSILK